MTGPASPYVAFGFRINGAGSHALSTAACQEWPDLDIRHRIARTMAGRGHLSGASAKLRLGASDWLMLDRNERKATYLTKGDIDQDTLVHPWLGPAAGVMAQWLGRQTFHAGAFLANGGAWAIAGSNEAGKSSLLAALAMAGRSILTDDLLVVHRGLAYAGPRCIDLRELHALDAASADRVRVVREGTRYRMDLAAVEAAVPLRGWFFLEWGTKVEALPSRAADCLPRLGAQRRWATGAADPHVLLELSCLPAWELRRPRGWSHMNALVKRLHELTADSPRGAQRDRSAGGRLVTA